MRAPAQSHEFNIATGFSVYVSDAEISVGWQSASCLDTRIPPDGERLEPRSGSCWIDVTKTISERGGSSFYPSKDTFDSVPISVTTHLKSEAESIERGFAVVRMIDEDCGTPDRTLLSELSQERHRSCRGTRRKYTAAPSF